MPGTLLHAYLLAIRSELHAFFMINFHNIAFKGNRLGRAYLYAEFTGNTAHLADLFYGRTCILAAAGHPYPCSLGYKLYNLFWACLHACAASYTSIWIH